MSQKQEMGLGGVTGTAGRVRLNTSSWSRGSRVRTAVITGNADQPQPHTNAQGRSGRIKMQTAHTCI